jgi:hypothetical protein
MAPRTMDVYMEQTMFRQQKDPTRSIPPVDSLYAPTRDGDASGPYDGHVMRSSLYTKAAMSDVTRAMPFIAAGAMLAAGMSRWRTSEPRQ